MNQSQLSLSQAALLAAHAVGMAGGQVLFKLAADHYRAGVEAAVGHRLLALL